MKPPKPLKKTYDHNFKEGARDHQNPHPQLCITKKDRLKLDRDVEI